MADLRPARRYAAALFNTALRLEAIDRVQEDLAAVVEVLQQNPALREALESPVVPEETKKRLWDDLIGGTAHPLTLQFLKVLIERQRTGTERAVLLAYTEMVHAHRGMVAVEVTTAVELPPDLRESLARRLEQVTGRRVVMQTRVDPSILGGVIVRTGDRLLDGSIKGQLEQLRVRLAGERRL